jgi:hypothetical protein
MITKERFKMRERRRTKREPPLQARLDQTWGDFQSCMDPRTAQGMEIAPLLYLCNDLLIILPKMKLFRYGPICEE